MLHKTDRITGETVFFRTIVAGFLFCISCHSPVFAQPTTKYHITGTAVPGTNIRCVASDQRQFLWVGTQDGLMRYDSRHTRVYNQKGSYKSNIGGSDVRDICVWDDQTWITTTQGGVDAIDCTSSNPALSLPQGRFKGLGNYTITSLVHSDSLLYIGSEKGLYTYNKRNRILADLPVAGLPAPASIDKLVLQGNFLLLFIRNYGIASLDISTGRVIDILNTLQTCHLAQHRFYAIAGCSDGTWLAGTSNGLEKVGIRPDGHLDFQVAAFPCIPASCRQDIYAVAIDQQHQTWFSTENNLFCIDETNKKYTVIDNALQENNTFLNSVYSLFCDANNNLWLGCQAGLFYLKNAPAPTVTYTRPGNNNILISDAYYLYPADDSTLLVTGENFLYKLNTHTGNIGELDNTQPYDFVFKDPFGKTLVSNKGGLQYLHGSRFTPIATVYPEFRPFSGYTLNSAVLINASEIVMGTENIHGVLLWNFRQHRVTGINTASPGMQLDNNSINNVFRLRENVCCILTESSLLYMDRKLNIIRRIHLKKDSSGEEFPLLFDMCRVKDRYYLSSYGNGVLEMDTLFRVKRILTTAEGLSNNSVYKLLPYKDSLLFMTTNLGLTILNTNTGALRRLFKSDGLHDDVFEETSGYVYGNTIFAGGRHGVTALYPDYIRANRIAPLLYLNALNVMLPGGITTDSTNLGAKHFFIPNNALQVKLFLSGINFSNPARTHFAYMIRELHKDWIDMGVQDFITLTGMPPGDYHLLVKAGNEDDTWSSPCELELYFQPRWYQTWLFKILVVALVSGILYALYHYRIAQIRKQQEIRKNIATDLHDSLGSSLTSINVLVNLSLNSPNPAAQLSMVKESVSEATAALRDLIWVLDDSLDTADELVTRVRQYALPVCAATNIDVSFRVDGDAGQVCLTKSEKRNLLLLCKETIHNSIKYATATNIDIIISTAGSRIQVILHDNGKGFDRHLVKKGYGLDNISYRAAQIGYAALIESAPGKGTTVIITPK